MTAARPAAPRPSAAREDPREHEGNPSSPPPSASPPAARAAPRSRRRRHRHRAATPGRRTPGQRRDQRGRIPHTTNAPGVSPPAVRALALRNDAGHGWRRLTCTPGFPSRSTCCPAADAVRWSVVATERAGLVRARPGTRPTRDAPRHERSPQLPCGPRPGTPRQEFFNELADMATAGRQPSEDELIGIHRRHDHYLVDVVAET